MPDNKICPKFDLLPIYFIPLTRERLEVLLPLIKFLTEYGKIIIVI